MKRFIFITLLVFVWASSCSVSKTLTQAPVSAPCVVIVETSSGRGTGFFVDSNIVTTNAHVVGVTTEAEVTFRDGTMKHFSVVYSDTILDIALLQVIDTIIPETYQAVFADLPRSESIITYTGHPAGNLFAEIGGVYHPKDIIKDPKGNTHLIPGNIFTLPGASGAPVYTRDLRVIGMVRLWVSRDDGISSNKGYFIPSGSIQDALRQYYSLGEERQSTVVSR
ncbi:trypsin-like peptidase domain-containing protein [Candidatus Nomurabacteria bacterium]|nr:trypsin-like peptidase domain-containing protein [Candidatus Nomurabacteria bacterium]